MLEDYQGYSTSKDWWQDNIRELSTIQYLDYRFRGD